MSSLKSTGYEETAARDAGFHECAGLKWEYRHDLCEHTSLAICFQLEDLQSGTILIKSPLAGIVATHSRENVAVMPSLLPARYTFRLTRIPSCRHGARCGCTLRTSAERPQVQTRPRREWLQSSSSLPGALSYACLWCPINEPASRVGQNSCSRLVVEQLGLQNLVNIDVERNQQVTGRPASGRRPLSIVSTSKVAFSDNFWALSDFQAASASPCQPDFRANLASAHNLVEKPDFSYVVLQAPSRRSRDHADAPRARGAARSAPAHLLSDARRCAAVQGGALCETCGAVRRWPVRRPRWRPRCRRHEHHPGPIRLRSCGSHLRRHHPGRLADV